eukprot:2898511-Pleurochrysis_carterae.AAC.1
MYNQLPANLQSQAATACESEAKKHSRVGQRQLVSPYEDGRTSCPVQFNARKKQHWTRAQMRLCKRGRAHAANLVRRQRRGSFFPLRGGSRRVACC